MTEETRKLAVAAVALEEASATDLAGKVALRAVHSLLAEPAAEPAASPRLARLTANDKATMRAMWAAGVPASGIAKAIRCSPATVRHYAAHDREHFPYRKEACAENTRRMNVANALRSAERAAAAAAAAAAEAVEAQALDDLRAGRGA